MTDTQAINCPSCAEKFEARLGNSEEIAAARKQFEQHMDKAHQYVLREGWGWIPKPKVVKK